MKVGVMQPYLFPYIGYYQLVNSVDKFVFYDDVTFIKQSYINRNSILSPSGSSYRFTLPVLKASSFEKINSLYFDSNTKKILRTMEQTYSKAPFFKKVFPIVEATLTSSDRKVSTLNAKSVKDVFSYLDIRKEFFFASEIEYKEDLTAEKKLIDITKRLGGSSYVNSYGGKELYSLNNFKAHDLGLTFIKPRKLEYKQISKGNKFAPNLSMIDVLMHNDVNEVKKLLIKCEVL
jgi:hypothetical protein